MTKARPIDWRETTDIRARLDALPNTDLNSSISSLREGINLPNIAIEKFASAATRFGQAKEPTDVFDGALALRFVHRGKNLRSKATSDKQNP